VRSRFAQALLNNKEGRNLWDEIKRITGKRIATANIVDGHIRPEDIANMFADKCEQLYNCVSYELRNERS
jgi:hypothetical protein